MNNPCKANSYFRITANGKIARKGSQIILGWTVKETIGIGVINPRGLARSVKTKIIGE